MRRFWGGLAVVTFILSTTGFCFAYEKEVKALSGSMVQKITKAGKRNVAVVDFTDLQGNVTELGRFLAEELSSDLSEGAVGFEIIDRNHLKSILNEHKLSLSGLVDPKTVKQLGQLAGVDALVTGTVTPFGDSIRVSGKVIATDTAKVIATAKGDIAKTKAIEELLSKGIETRSEASTATAASSSAPKPSKGKQSVEVKNFLFELQGCNLSGQTVTCNLTIINKDNDRNLTMEFYNTRIIDDAGNEAAVNTIQLGNERKSRPWLTKQLASGVPIKASLTFEAVTAQPVRLSLLEIGCNANVDFKAQIRNIALSK